jgi:putative membrane protein
MMGGMMLPMFLGLLLVVSLVTLMIVLFVRGRKDGQSIMPCNSLTILQERFARGEIDVEEYQQRRGILLDQS